VWNVLGKNSGTGIYNRCAPDAGGQAPGSTKSYAVTLKRTTGKAKSGTYGLSFKGNDGTFSVSPSSVSLPLNQPVTVTVTAKPSAGGHSTTMLIEDPQTKGLDGSMMAVVAAGKSFDSPSYTINESGTAKRNVAKSYFVTVPKGAKALTVSMSGLQSGSQTRFLTFHPYGLPLDNTSTPNCYSNYGTPEGNGCNPATRTYANPTPGVWEILVESRRTSPLLDNPFTLTAGVVGVQVDPASQTVPTAAAGQATALSWTVKNLFAGVTATASGGGLGSAKKATPTIADLTQQTFTVVVPAGADKLDVSIGNTSDKAADLDLFVTGPGGNKQSADGDSEEAVSYTNPAPGTYTVTVDGYSVPNGTTTYDYVDVFYGGSLGSISVDEPSTFELPADASHTVTGSVTANVAPAAGRVLFGEMTVKNEAGIVLGTGAVTVEAVTTP
jgi:hypothetical protein